MTRYFVGIGSNENAIKNCTAMITIISNTFERVYLSSVVKTPAFGVNASDYVNAVVSFESSIDRFALCQWCKDIEIQLGRTRSPDGVCQADMDILDPDDVREPYFQPLINQLQSYLKGKRIICVGEQLELKLGLGVSVGLEATSLSNIFNPEHGIIPDDA